MIAERKLTLERLIQIQIMESEPVLVTSSRLYGNLERCDEIQDLNEIEHPGFVPSLVDINVQVE